MTNTYYHEQGLTLIFFTQILDRDNRGRVKGMGNGVSKTSIKYSDPYKKALQKEHELQVILQTQVDNLEKRLEVESRDLRREMD